MEKKITVWIACKKVVHFNQQVELTPEEYQILKGLDLDDVYEDDKAYRIIDRHIDFMDILDSDNEFTDVQVSKD